MKIRNLFAACVGGLVICLSNSWAANSPAVSNALPPLLREVEAKYTKAGTIMVEFKQINESTALKKKSESSGIIMVKRPNKVRWETLKPDPNLLVSDGRKFWYYTPPFDEGEHGQVIEKKSSDVQSRVANALLSGSFSVARDMKIKQQGASTFRLSFKPGSAGTVETAEIRVDPKNKLITNVTLRHKGGNSAQISLSNIELGKPLRDDLFYFVAPPNTDKVQE